MVPIHVVEKWKQLSHGSISKRRVASHGIFTIHKTQSKQLFARTVIHSVWRRYFFGCSKAVMPVPLPTTPTLPSSVSGVAKIDCVRSKAPRHTVLKRGQFNYTYLAGHPCLSFAFPFRFCIEILPRLLSSVQLLLLFPACQHRFRRPP